MSNIDNTKILEFKQQKITSSSSGGGGNNNNLLLLTNNTISSSIQVNIKELNLKIYNEIIISWNILNNEETSINDWIGIYKIEGIFVFSYNLSLSLTIILKTALDSNDYLEIKILDTFNGSKIGHLTWILNKLKNNKLSNIEGTIFYLFIIYSFIYFSHSLDNDLVEFRYYNGLNNRLLSKSNSLKFIKYKNESINCLIKGLFK